MRRKDGFTLIELIGVVVILGAISLIAFPTIITNLQKTEEQDYEAFLKTIYLATETYVESNMDMFNLDNVESIDYVLLSELIDEAYLNGNTINPKTKDTIKNESSIIELSKEIDGTISYEYFYSGLDSLVMVKYIEDLVSLSQSVNGGSNKSDIIYHLNRDLDFLESSSYLNVSSTSYGDINENGIVETIKVELTTGKGFKPIGIVEKEFSGSFYGRNRTIKNLYINRPTEDDIGLFGNLSGGFINSIILEGANVTGGNRVGLITGSMYLGSHIEDIETTGYVYNSGHSLGGIIGYVSGSNVKNCSSSANVEGVSTVESGFGGIAGSIRQGSVVENSNFNGNLESSSVNIGGIVGFSEASVCKEGVFEGKISAKSVANDSIGGIVGSSTLNSEIVNSSSVGTITNVGLNTGGIVGKLDSSSVKNCFSSSLVTGDDYVGGMAGKILNNASISRSYTSNWIEGTDYIGGIAGNASTSNFDKSYSIATVKGYSYIGGIVGSITGATILNDSYATGDIIRDTQYGSGAVGYIDASYTGSHSNLYYYSDQIYIDFSGNTFTPNVTIGTTVSNTNLISPTWQQNILGIHYSYTAGRYPQLYKAAEDDSPRDILLPKQEINLVQ